MIPNNFFGSIKNKKSVLEKVDRFVRLNRYESLSLHEVLQGLKVAVSPRLLILY